MQGGRMKMTVCKILGALLSANLMTQPLFAAYAPVPGSAMDTTPATAATAAGEDLSATSLTSNPAKQGEVSRAMGQTISMNNLPLPKTAISMDFQDADIRDVMHLMAVKSGVNIIFGADVSGPVTIHLDRVPFDQAFQTVMTLKGLVALQLGPRVIRVISSTGLSQEQSQATTFTKVFILKYANATDIKTPLDAIRSAANRKGVSSIDARNNALIITDTNEGLKEVEELIPTLDRKPQQVDIEAKVVEVSLDDDSKLGVSWAFAKGPNSQYGNFIGGTTATESDTGAGNNGGSGPSLGGTAISVNPPPSGTGVNFIDQAAASVAAFTFLHSEQAFMLSAQLSALASKQKVKILSTPHVVTLNNVDAQINVIDQIPYQVQTLTTNNQPGQITYQFAEAGVKLAVRPTVNADRRITLKVKPEVSRTGPPPLPGAPPSINTRNAETTVLLRDGETIAIGGLITENTGKTVTGIPILMSIPVIGWLFKGKEDRVQRVELIVFLTPRIAAE
jgi:type IV pilus assembly protein PilQ